MSSSIEFSSVFLLRNPTTSLALFNFSARTRLDDIAFILAENIPSNFFDAGEKADHLNSVKKCKSVSYTKNFCQTLSSLTIFIFWNEVCFSSKKILHYFTLFFIVIIPTRSFKRGMLLRSLYTFF